MCDEMIFIMALGKIRMKTSGIFIGLMIFLLSTGVSFAAHPLITDDALTVGEGKAQLEVTGEYGYDENEGVTVRAIDIEATVTYGLLNNLDIVCGIPMHHIKTKIDATPFDSGGKTTEDGLGDISLEAKWKFFEGRPLSFALKPCLTVPTGDHEKGMGAGKVTYGAYFISTGEFNPWAVHFNLGYTENRSKLDERKGIWHASIAGEFAMDERLKLVANIGSEKNTDKASSINPAFALGGLIYTVQKNLDVDCGVKIGLNTPETDIATLAGITWHF
jgi:hypothetical protein